MAENNKVPTTAGVHVFGSIGKVTVFDDRTLYQKRLVQYFGANRIEEARKVPVLLSVIGFLIKILAYKIVKDLSDPILPSKRLCDKICQLLYGHFIPTVSVFRKRIDFYNLRQTDGETCSNWYAEIKNASIQCKFGLRSNDVLRQVLFGM